MNSERQMNDNNRLIEDILKYVNRRETPQELIELFKVGGIINRVANEGGARAHQLRRFYDYLVSLQDKQKIQGPRINENAIRFQVLRMIPLANYSSSSKKKLLPEILKDFISKSAEEVAKKNGEEFVSALERFRNVFEAIIAFRGGE
ncbi:MAG: type III-A CRISPR-associated protein Csm2 [Thermoplasmatales archaeon]